VANLAGTGPGLGCLAGRWAPGAAEPTAWRNATEPTGRSQRSNPLGGRLTVAACARSRPFADRPGFPLAGYSRAWPVGASKGTQKYSATTWRAATALPGPQ